MGAKSVVLLIEFLMCFWTGLLVGLKYCGFINIPWTCCFTPIFLPIVLVFFVSFVMVLWGKND